MAKIISAVALLYLVALLFFGWGLLTVKLEWFPFKYIEPLYQEIFSYFDESHRDSIADMARFGHQERPTKFEFSGLRISDPDFHDDGYLLLARYSKQHNQAIAELFSLSENRVLHSWVPDLDAIFAMTPENQGAFNTHSAYRTQHPLLLPNGDLVISSGEGPLVRIDTCGRPVWAIDRHFHHTIELNSRDELVVPLVFSSGRNEFGLPMRNDGFAIVSLDGEILTQYSLHQLLLESGYRGLLYGVGDYEEDRFHLNDVQPLHRPGQNDLVLLSIRNISSIAILDLSDSKLLDLQTGPWLNQHDINVLPDGRFSIFGNNVVRGANVILGARHSEVYLLNPESGEVSTPWSNILAQVDMATLYEGRSRVLENGDVFIEETNRDRLLRVSRDKLRWEFVNKISDNTTGALHLSRYLEKSMVTPGLLQELTCEEHSS